METKRPLNRRLTLDRARTVICTLGGVAVKVLLVLIVALVCRFTATAQTTTGVVNGTVTDGSGSVIAGATVTATNTQTGAASSETVGESGRYTITNLTPGLYDIEASSQGFASVVRRNQELLLGTTATVDFSLQVASVAQTVEITGAPPAIETTTSQVDQVIETTQLDTLPTLQRSFSVLAQLTPGVLLNAAGTTVTVGDSGVQASNYIIDGSSVSDQNAGGLTISLAQDWIQEFSVLTQIAPAEYGFATSGIVNAITRSGGNRIHGRAYGYFQNAALNAAPAFLPKSAPNKPPYNQERVGGTFGGPITKDKLFYFLGYERLQSLTSIAINVPPAFDTAGPVNTSSGVFPQSVAQNLAIGKLDYAPSSKNSWHLKGMLQDTVTGNAAIGAGASTITTVSGGDTQVGYTVNYELSWDHTFSSRMLNEARFNFIKDAGNTLDNIRAELGPYTCANALYPGQCDKDGDPVGYYSSVTYTTAQVTVGITSQGCRCEKYVTGADTLTLTSGNHTFKFGTDSGYRGFSNTDLDFNGDGEYTIANGTSPFNPAATAASVFPTSGTCTVSCYPTAYTLYGHPGGASPKDSGASVNSPDPYMSLFAQDSWKIKDNLTLNYGLRYDLDLGNQYVTVFPGLNAMTTDFHDFQPRMGFAWTPFHDNDRTVIRGGSGLYYNEFHGAFAAGVNNVNPPSAALVGGLPEDYTWAYNSTSTNPYCQVAVSSGGVACGNAVPAATEQAFEEVLAYALATYTVPNFNPNGAVGAGQTFTITMPNGGPTYAVPAITQTVPPFQLTVDPNYKSPGAVQSSIGLQHQFSNSLTVSADFGYLRYFSLELMHNSNVNLQGQTINPSFGLLKSMQYNGKGSEYTLRAKVTYQDHRGDSLLGAYGLGYAWDNSVGPGSTGTFQVNFNSAPLSTNPFNPQRDWGPSNSLPVSILNISGAIRGVYGIQLSPIIQFNTGLRLTPTTSARSGPLVSACPAYFNTCYPAAPYDTKNQFVGDSFFTAGGRLSEKLKLGEKYAATLMFEGYNINNRRNISSYSLNYTSNGTTVSSTFGNPTGAGPSRQLQAGFQFDF